MNWKMLLGIVYNRLINNAENMLIYKPLPAPIDKIKNKYRWRMVIKCKVSSKVLDIIKFSIEDEKIKKTKDTSIIIDINPNNMM